MSFAHLQQTIIALAAIVEPIEDDFGRRGVAQLDRAFRRIQQTVVALALQGGKYSLMEGGGRGLLCYGAGAGNVQQSPDFLRGRCKFDSSLEGFLQNRL